jgi:hypothetical protein
MYEICVQQMDEAFAALRQGKVPRREGNRDASVFHQGVYAAAGPDRWVAVTLHDRSDWTRARDALQIKCSEDAAEIDIALADWARTRTDIGVSQQVRLKTFRTCLNAIRRSPCDVPWRR